MIKNLNDNTRYMKKWEGSSTENDSEWMVIALLISAILILGYLILG